MFGSLKTQKYVYTHLIFILIYIYSNYKSNHNNEDVIIKKKMFYLLEKYNRYNLIYFLFFHVWTDDASGINLVPINNK